MTSLYSQSSRKEIKACLLEKHIVFIPLVNSNPLWKHHDKGIIPIPRLVPTSYYPSKVWSRFWSLPLAHNVVTPWWNPQLWDTPLGQVCSSAHESCSHFFVYCPVKWSFWRQALQLLNPVSSFSDNDIWAALSTLHDLQGRPYSTDILVFIGIILDTVWQYHFEKMT
ncbi:MAG: hypothetical protein EXX96DRAFT_537286 [Benjaminiella poitrasii]|nr:MAG: hypothetical protein EXX96DRAFT_537286 [Benjaminiella poitrasii]